MYYKNILMGKNIGLMEVMQYKKCVKQMLIIKSNKLTKLYTTLERYKMISLNSINKSTVTGKYFWRNFGK